MTSRDLAFSFSGHRRQSSPPIGSIDNILQSYACPNGLVALSVGEVSIEPLKALLAQQCSTLRSLSLKGVNACNVFVGNSNYIDEMLGGMKSRLTSLAIKIHLRTHAAQIAAQFSRLSSLVSLDILSPPNPTLETYLAGATKLQNLVIRGEFLEVDWTRLTSLRYFRNPVLAGRMMAKFFSQPRLLWTVDTFSQALRQVLPPGISPQYFLGSSSVCAARWATQYGSEYLAADLFRVGYDRGGNAASVLAQALARNEQKLAAAALAAGLAEEIGINQISTLVFTCLSNVEQHNSAVAKSLFESLKDKFLNHPEPRFLMRDTLSRTALMHMSSCADDVGWDVFEWLLTNLSRLQLDINDVDDCGNSALHHLLFNAGTSGSVLAAYSGMSSIKKKLHALLNAGANVSLENARGETPSSVASRYGIHELIFCKRHFKLERERDVDKLFPGELLFRAAMEKFDGMVRLLLRSKKYSSWIDPLAEVPSAAKRYPRWNTWFSDDPHLAGSNLIQIAARYSDFASFCDIFNFSVSSRGLLLDLPRFLCPFYSPLVRCCLAICEASSYHIWQAQVQYELSGDHLSKLVLLLHATLSSTKEYLSNSSAEDSLEKMFSDLANIDVACEDAINSLQLQPVEMRHRHVSFLLPGVEYKGRAQLIVGLDKLRNSRSFGKFFPKLQIIFAGAK